MRPTTRHPIALLLFIAAALFPTALRAGDYDADIKDAVIRINQIAGDTGMTDRDRIRFCDLLFKYNDERTKLLELMVTIVSKSDVSEQHAKWTTVAEKGRELFERLDRDVPKTNGNEGLAAAGLTDFAKGEKRMWDETVKGEIALSAQIINTITQSDLEIIKKCDTDLKTCRDNDRAIQAMLQACENDITKSIKDFTKELGKKLGEKALTSWLKEGNAKEAAKEMYKTHVKLFESNLKSAKERRLLKEILLQDIELVSKSKEKLGESAIEDQYKKAVEAGKNLRSVGSVGEYKAADFDRFQETAVKGLSEAKSRAMEQTKKLFNELLPVFVEENQKKFATVKDDPSKLADWEKSVMEDFKSMDEVLDKQDEITKELSKGAYRTAVEETMKEIRDHIKNSVQAARETSKSSDEEMKK